MRHGRTLIAILASAVAGSAIVVWAFTDRRFWSAAGEPDAIVAFLFAVAATMVIATAVALFWSARFAFWLAIALLGQGVMLQLIDAGNLVGYQHLRPLARMPGEIHPVLLASLPVQALVVGWVGRRAIGDALRWTRANLRAWQIVALLLAFVLSSAVVSREPRLYVEELVLASLLQLLALATIVVAAASLASRPARFERLLPSAEPGPRRRGLDPVAVGAALWVIVAASLLNILSYQRHPHVPDEVAYLMHARYFAEGVLATPAPPVPEAFKVYLMEHFGGQWYSVVPPGWPLALTVGEVLGAPWIVNPLLAGLCVLVTWSLVRSLYSERTARLAVLLLAASPWFLFTSMSFMTHTLSLLFALLGAWAVMRMREDGRWRWAVLGGIGIGVVGLTRPLEGLILAVLLGLWALGPDWRRPRIPHAVAMAVASVAAVATTFPYNAHFTGRPTEFPLMAYAAREFPVGSNALGFGPDRGLGWPGLDPFPGHGAIDVVVNANLNIGGVNTELLGWSTGSLLLPALALFWMPKRRADWLMLVAVAAVIGAHSFYWFSGGPDFGARYWYLAIIPLIVLSARAVEELEHRVGAGHGWRVTAAALVLVIASLATYIPWRAVDKYFHYRGMRPDMRELAAGGTLGRSLVLVRGRQHPDYASAAFYNPLDFRADAPIFAWDRDAQSRAKVLAAYADRPVWIVEGPSVSGRGFEVVAGPLTAAAVLAGAADSSGTRHAPPALLLGR